MKNSWTPELDSELKLLLSKGVSVQRIAVRLNRTQSVVKGRARFLGLELPSIPSAKEPREVQRWAARKPASKRRSAPES